MKWVTTSWTDGNMCNKTIHTYNLQQGVREEIVNFFYSTTSVARYIKLDTTFWTREIVNNL